MAGPSDDAAPPGAAEVLGGRNLLRAAEAIGGSGRSGWARRRQEAGLAAQRDQIGAELVTLSAQHGLGTFEILGHLVRLQARSALADFATGDQHAAAANRLAERYDRPLVGVFTQWYRALRLAATEPSPQAAEVAYRDGAAQLANAGMPGVERGLLPLALLCLRVSYREPVRFDDETDWARTRPGYAHWSRKDGAARPMPPRRCVRSPIRRATCCSRPCGASPPKRRSLWTTGR